MHSFAQTVARRLIGLELMPLSFVSQRLQMSVPGSAGFLGIPGRSVQINCQMQLLLLQGENKPVNKATAF